MAEQFDMLVVDRSHTGSECADQTYRVVAAADAGLEHGEIALAFLKMQAGEREHGFEGAEFLAPTLRYLGDSSFDSQRKARLVIIANGRSIDLKTLVDTK